MVLAFIPVAQILLRATMMQLPMKMTELAITAAMQWCRAILIMA